MRRVNTRGLAKANKCMIMAAMAYNLKKLLRFSKRKAESMEITVRAKASSALQSFLFSVKVTMAL